MLITAHSGAQKTKPNGRDYLEAVGSGRISADAFEVDVRYRKGCLYLSHFPSLFPQKKTALAEALSVAKEKNVKINLDVKEHGIFEKVQDLVLSMGMDEQIIYTGNVSPKEAKKLSAGVLYANVYPFCKGLRPVPEDAEVLKEALKKHGERVVGLNINYKWTEPGFYAAAADAGLALSVYTVDDPIALEKLSCYNFSNLTTHCPREAKKYFKERLLNG